MQIWLLLELCACHRITSSSSTTQSLLQGLTEPVCVRRGSIVCSMAALGHLPSWSMRLSSGQTRSLTALAQSCERLDSISQLFRDHTRQSSMPYCLSSAGGAECGLLVCETM